MTARILGLTLTALIALPATVWGDTLLCLGTRPGFMMVIETDSVAFDYLGDGRYTLDPPLQGPGFGFATHELVTMRERWDVFLEERSCEVIRATLPVTLEIAVPTSAGDRPLSGCCKWQTR